MREQGRELRLAELLHEELAGIIQFEMRDPRIGLVNVNDVRITRDLAFADVYVSTLGGDAAEEPSAEQKDALVAVLNGASGFFGLNWPGVTGCAAPPSPAFTTMNPWRGVAAWRSSSTGPGRPTSATRLVRSVTARPN